MAKTIFNGKITLTSVLFFLVSIIILAFNPLKLPDSTTPVPAGTQAPIVSTSSSGLSVKVTKVVDGDTIEVDLNGNLKRVRLIGINTPETVDPRRGVQCFGHEASSETKLLLNGQSVVLEKDVSEHDKYDRLLRYVYLPRSDGTMLFVNDYLVRVGYAQVSSYPPDVKYQTRFVQAEEEARNKKLGLWGKCYNN